MLSFSAVDVCVFALQSHIHNILLVWQKPYNGLSVCLPAEALIVKQHTHRRLFTLSYYPWLCRNDALERPSCLSFPWCPHCPANLCRIICFIISLTYCYSPQQMRCWNQFNANLVRLSFISCNFITYLFRRFESMMFCIAPPFHNQHLSQAASCIIPYCCTLANDILWEDCSYSAGLMGKGGPLYADCLARSGLCCIPVPSPHWSVVAMWSESQWGRKVTFEWTNVF